MPQLSKEWFDVRRGVPTASNADKIITPKTGKPSASSEKYIDRLIADMYDPAYGTEVQFTNYAMDRGNRLEPEARKFIAMELDCELTQVGFCLSDCGRFGMSPDALIGTESTLELKVPLPETHVGYLRAGTLPDDYKPQVHFQLLVSKLPSVIFASYCPGMAPLIVEVMRDGYTELLRVALDDFLTRYTLALDKMNRMR